MSDCERKKSAAKLSSAGSIPIEMSPSDLQSHAAFLPLYVEHEPSLRGFVRSLVPTLEDANDVMQEAAMALWKRFHTLSAPEDFRRWAFGVARLEALEFLRKKGRDPGQFDLDAIVDATIDYSGAELEQAVIASLYDAFDTGNDLTTDGLLNTLRDIVPLAITMREQIEAMREWARTRARPAAQRGGPPPKKEGWMAKYGAPTSNLGDKGGDSDDGERKLEL